jgi:uncharacterized protein with PIN domain
MAHLRDALTVARPEPALLKADSTLPAETVEPRCPSCGEALHTTLAERMVPVRQEPAGAKSVAVIYCGACGTALGVTRP